MFCRKCGTELPDDDVQFCPKCGSATMLFGTEIDFIPKSRVISKMNQERKEVEE